MSEARSSYVHGVSEEPLLGLTVGACLDRAAERLPRQEALRVPYQDLSLGYAELRDLADRLAAGLLALGLEPGDRVGILAPNRSEWVVVQFATAKAGLILVNINPAYRARELEHALQAVGCKALLAVSHFKSSRYFDMLREICPELLCGSCGERRSERVPSLRYLIDLDGEGAPATLAYGELPSLAGASEIARVRELGRRLQFDDPVNIQFTSGTTGTPKAATLTHHNIVNNAYLVGQRMGLSPADRLCIPVPMYHCFGMVLGTLCCVAHGATIVFSSPGFDARAVLETVQRERCTALHGVPTMFIAELDHPDFHRFDLGTLRTGIMAGAPCPAELMKRVMSDMHLSEITIAYGMTETGPVSFQTAVDDPFERRVGTVGRVMPHTEVKIVDENGAIVPRGQVGQLLTRGYCVMARYWGDPERTREAIDAARWMASGDLARLDERGYCEIVGRLKDMIIRGGENIYPAEIEALLYTHPKIEQAEVVGVPDPKYGEEICAWVKLREGERATAEAIETFCRERIAHFKVPRYIELVEDFPMTATGKVQKFVIRERMTARSGKG